MEHELPPKRTPPPVEKKKQLPKESRPGDSHITDHDGQKVDVYKLIHLAESLPEEAVDMASLTDCREGNYWHDKNGDWLGPHHILDELTRIGGNTSLEDLSRLHPAWADEIAKIQKAEYEMYPILIIGDTVVDGLHRFTRAVIEGRAKIKAKRFSILPSEAVVKA